MHAALALLRSSFKTLPNRSQDFRSMPLWPHHAAAALVQQALGSEYPPSCLHACKQS
jgi:hypothetical protein